MSSPQSNVYTELFHNIQFRLFYYALLFVAELKILLYLLLVYGPLWVSFCIQIQSEKKMKIKIKRHENLLIAQNKMAENN